MANWTLTRKDTSDPLELPGDMRWTDEFDWQALAQSNVQYSLGGAAIIQQGTMLAGRPITLGGGVDMAAPRDAAHAGGLGGCAGTGNDPHHPGRAQL